MFVFSVTRSLILLSYCLNVSLVTPVTISSALSSLNTTLGSIVTSVLVFVCTLFFAANGFEATSKKSSSIADCLNSETSLISS